MKTLSQLISAAATATTAATKSDWFADVKVYAQANKDSDLIIDSKQALSLIAFPEQTDNYKQKILSQLKALQ